MTSCRVLLSSNLRPNELCGRERLFESRRRRSNRPGNSQANGPQRDGALESGFESSRDKSLTEGESRGSTLAASGQSLRSSDRGGSFCRNRRKSLLERAMSTLQARLAANLGIKAVPDRRSGIGQCRITIARLRHGSSGVCVRSWYVRPV